MTELNLLADLDQVVDGAVELGNVDHNEESKGGGFERVLLNTGVYPMFLCQYIEMGTQRFKGFEGAKDTFSKGVQYAFAVFNFEELDEAGNPQVAIIGSGFPIKMSLNERAEFKRLFKALNYNDDPNMKHMAKFLGNKNTYTGKVVKKKSKAGKEYNSIEVGSLTPAMEGGFGKQTRAVLPDIDMSDYAVFLWDNPVMAHWNSLQRGKDASAGDPKNFIQYGILQATDFEGSAVDLMLREAGTDTTLKPKAKKDPNQEVDDSVPFEADEKPTEKVERTIPATMPTMPEDDEE